MYDGSLSRLSGSSWGFRTEHILAATLAVLETRGATLIEVERMRFDEDHRRWGDGRAHRAPRLGSRILGWASCTMPLGHGGRRQPVTNVYGERFDHVRRDTRRAKAIDEGWRKAASMGSARRGLPIRLR